MGEIPLVRLVGSSLSELVELKNPDIKNPGLDEDLVLIRISSRAEQDWRNLELNHGVIFEEGLSGPRRHDSLNQHKVLVEFKSFAPAADGYIDLSTGKGSKQVIDRIRQLATLLHNLHSDRSRFFFAKASTETPKPCNTGLFSIFLQGVRTIPKSPKDLISMRNIDQYGRDVKSTVSLGCRVSLTLTLEIALFQFHTVGWVHKSIRSDNILFFPEHYKDITVEDMIEPWIVGFEYSRDEQGCSDK